MTGPYAVAAEAYWRNGWTNPLPVVGKSTPPSGYTGRDGRNVTWPDLQAWLAGPEASRNIGLRSQGSWVGIDIDAYDGKTGAATLAAAETDLGSLPATITSTSRGPGQPSRIAFYAVPAGTDLRHAQNLITKRYGDHIDIVWRGHRYAIVWPSVHPHTGNTYRWYALDGSPLDGTPRLADMAPLPQPWLNFFTTPATPTPPATATFAAPSTAGPAADVDAVRVRVAQLGDELSRAPEGTGNNTAARIAFMVGGYIGAGQISFDEAERCLLAALNGWTWRDDASKLGMAQTINAQLSEGAQQPRPWTAAQPRVNQAAMIAELLGTAPAAAPPPDDDQGLFPPPYDPMPVARQLLRDRQEHGVLTIRRWRGGWMVWTGPAWAEVEHAMVTSWAWRDLEHARYLDCNQDPPKVKPWRPNSRRISDVISAVSAVAHLPEAVNPPAWSTNRSTKVREDTSTSGQSFGSSTDGWSAKVHEGPRNSESFISTANGLLNVATRELLPHTPKFFNLVSVPFDYDPGAPAPARWLKFLADLWPGEPDAVEALQEWFGYVLSGRTDLHKILLVVGPPRGGKGTIARILTALVGKGSMAGPTLAGLNTNFGLAPLLGKPLAIISDARLAGRDNQQVVERLLTISGEDTMTVDRKNREAWTGQLPTRLMILSNELPNFGDASGAIATRFVTLMLTNSWLGAEDVNLGRDLNAELPGILNWALDGLERIERTDRITEPESSRDAVMAMMDQASPMSAFVRESCEQGPAHEVAIDTLWEMWREWCQDNGRDKPGTKQAFGRNLRSVVPGMRIIKKRNGDTRTPTYVGIRISEKPQNSRTFVDPRGPASSEQRKQQPVSGGPMRTVAAPSADLRCLVCHEPIDPVTAPIHPTCEQP